MEKELAKKVLLITGATSGIGKAAALRFAQAGASIAAVGRNEQLEVAQVRPARLARRLRARSHGAIASACLTSGAEPLKSMSLMTSISNNAVRAALRCFLGTDSSLRFKPPT